MRDRPAENYCSRLWAAIYDQYNRGRHEAELAFYSDELSGTRGAVLEGACGTGMILLQLLAQGLDMHGFDVSQAMLDVLVSKPEAQRWYDLRQRVSRQNLVDFRYDFTFDAVIIPARSFLHLTTQEEQIACLRTIHSHLAPSGKLLLNFFTPHPRHILAQTDSDPTFEEFATFVHPDSEEPVRLLFRQVNDLPRQLQRITWRFIYQGETTNSTMTVRWIHRSEFELLAKLTGFGVEGLYGGFSRQPYTGREEMVWVLEKR
jgi:SAM-dependent methyltransferase